MNRLLYLTIHLLSKFLNGIMGFKEYRFGTCTYLARFGVEKIIILGIVNSLPHNGCFELSLKQIEAYARQKKMAIVFLEIMEERFANYFILRGYAYNNQKRLAEKQF